MKNNYGLDAIPNDETTHLMKKSHILPTTQSTLRNGSCSDDEVRDIGIDNYEEMTTTAADDKQPSDFVSRCMHSMHTTTMRFLPYHPGLPIEANGCIMDVYARATIFMATFFVGPALLKLASQQAIANCVVMIQDVDAYNECTKEPRIYGFKPSSLLTNMGAAASFISVIRAVIDFTSYRRQVGMCAAFGLTLIKVLELDLGPANWFFVVCLQVLSAILFQTQKLAMYAYSAELSNQPTTQSGFQSSLALTLFGSMFLYMFEVQIPSRILKLETDVQIAKLAILVAIINCLPLFSFAWVRLFRDKPPASNINLPAPSSLGYLGQTSILLTAGFHGLRRTYHEINSNYRSVRHFLMFSLAWSEAGIAGLPIISTTYMSEILEMDSLQIGTVLLGTMIGGMPGSVIGNHFCRLYQNPVKSARVGLMVFTLNTIGAGLFLRPSTKNLMHVFAFVWGICIGWIHPQHTTIFVTISPSRDEGKGSVELMGLFLFSGQVLGFVPPLVFTILNEMGVPMWIGISTIGLYTLVGFVGLVYMGDYETARRSGSKPVADNGGGTNIPVAQHIIKSNSTAASR
eukprot:CAMPEP_0168170200 /NCGR_PEP_ID=MMETSP0139_2-20121125/4049_1 /TAXON_ID=44445 /ORGANISM="Pseudo-nitzschia australis, Strain 10249 10 AB" /LENGTH=571 /DNA_ID=CAMNT_0008087679 /DNA_START=94 /DNA_END=1809 /DNA_ORIENTATION=+